MRGTGAARSAGVPGRGHGAALDRALSAAQEAAGEALVPLLHAPSLGASAFVALGPTTVAYVAFDDASRQRLREEDAALRLLGAQGVPVARPRLLDPDGAWLLVERAPADPPAGAAYVDAAVEAARLLSGVRLPAPREVRLPPPGTPQGAARARGPRRLGTGAGGRVPPSPGPGRHAGELRDRARRLPPGQRPVRPGPGPR